MSQPAEIQFENQSLGEEIANSITHGVGAGLSLAATTLLVVGAALGGRTMGVVSFSIFGFSLFLLYLVSTLYHALRPPRAKRVFHLLDHSAIFVLIAGTYTPVTLLAMGGGWGWSLFGVIWGLAVVGVLITVLSFERTKRLTLALYIAMGWLIVIAMPRVIGAFSVPALIWLALGGLGYTVGVFFYRARRVKFHHMVWHLFVLGGSVCHFFMMMNL